MYMDEESINCNYLWFIYSNDVGRFQHAEEPTPQHVVDEEFFCKAFYPAEFQMELYVVVTERFK